MILFPNDTDATPHLFPDGEEVPTGKHPFLTSDTAFKERHAKYDEYGRWIGDDLLPDEDPARLITFTVCDKMTGRQIRDLFHRYEHADYGKGEAGFAVYSVRLDSGDNADAWIIDDAVRTPEGEAPARNPQLSPGPQTLLFPEDY